MTEYKLINPSDPYTFLAKTKESAALAVFLLGTMYGASPKDDNEEKRIPVFLFGGAEGIRFLQRAEMCSDAG